MTCEQVRELLAAEELRYAAAPEAKDACERHLLVCACCRRAFAEGKEMTELLESSLAVYKSGAAECAARIAAALPAQRVRSAYLGSRLFRLDAAAAVLLFGAGLFVGWLFQGGGAPSASPVIVERAPALAAPVVPQVVGNRATTAHQLLPGDRVRTSGQRSFIIVNPKRPDMSIEVDHNTVIEGNVPSPSSAAGVKEVPVE
jgi:hypothetical protein